LRWPSLGRESAVEAEVFARLAEHWEVLQDEEGKLSPRKLASRSTTPTLIANGTALAM
jgi:hypothetical protein